MNDTFLIFLPTLTFSIFMICLIVKQNNVVNFEKKLSIEQVKKDKDLRNARNCRRISRQSVNLIRRSHVNNELNRLLSQIEHDAFMGNNTQYYKFNNCTEAECVEISEKLIELGYKLSNKYSDFKQISY